MNGINERYMNNLNTKQCFFVLMPIVQIHSTAHQPLKDSNTEKKNRRQ